MHVFLYMGVPASFQKKRRKIGGGSRSRLAAASLCGAVMCCYVFLPLCVVVCGA